MALKQIRLELARDPEFPDGSRRHGYDIIAPLDDEGHLQVEEWRARKGECRVARFWGGEAEEEGVLRHRAGSGWAFHYDGEGEELADEPGYRFDTHSFVEGEYVSVREQDGSTRTFRIVSVKPYLVPTGRAR